MEGVIPLKVLGVPGLGESFPGQDDCSCPVLETSGQAVLARVEAELEGLRRQELRRSRRRLRGLTEAQRETVEQLTAALLRSAVLERIQEFVRLPDERQVLHEIREMFPARG